MLGVALYAAEKWTLTQTDRRLEAFEIWIWRRIKILNSIWQRKQRWIDHVLRYDGLLHGIIEGRTKGKPTRGRRRNQMLHNLANNDGFGALKQAAEDRGMDTEKGCQRPAVQQKTTDSWQQNDNIHG